jgi:hypothetical protein
MTCFSKVAEEEDRERSKSIETQPPPSTALIDQMRLNSFDPIEAGAWFRCMPLMWQAAGTGGVGFNRNNGRIAGG